VIIGESGIGKSRLLQEIRVRALVSGAKVLDGRQIQSKTGMIDLWRNALSLLVLSTPLRRSEVSILSEVIPDISRLSGEQVMPVPSISKSQRQQRLIRTIAKLFQRQVRPMVLLLEDVHWSKESLLPLAVLTQMISDLPLMVVVTYCANDDYELPDVLSDMRSLPLERLTNSEIARLSRSMLGDVGEQPEIVSFLQRETQGNVSYIIEVLRAFAEKQGRLSEIGQAFSAEHITSRNITELILQRLEYLDEWQFDLLNIAAIMGRRLNLPVLDNLLQEYALEDWLTACSNIAVLEFSNAAWQFTHEKLRSSLIDQLSEQQSQSIHHQIALSIESAYADDLDAHLAQLVVHWHHAANLHKEWEYAQLASQHAYSGVDFASAQNLYERALQLSGDLVDTPDQLELARLYQQLADIYLMTHRQADHTILNFYEQAMVLYESYNHQQGVAECLRGLGNLSYERTYDYPSALSFYESALQIYRTVDMDTEIVTLLIQIGNCWRRQNEWLTAEDYYYQSVQIAESMKDIWRMAQGLSQLGIVSLQRGLYADARDYLEKSLELYETIDELSGMVTALDYLAAVYIALDNIGVGQHFAYHALLQAHENKLDVAGLAVLVRFAMLKIASEQYETALSWLSLVIQHPHTNLDTLREAELLCNSIVDRISESTYESCWMQGQHMDYDALVQSILLDYASILHTQYTQD